MEIIPINWKLISHPINWVVIVLMLLIAGYAMHFVLPAFGVSQSNNSASN